MRPPSRRTAGDGTGVGGGTSAAGGGTSAAGVDGGARMTYGKGTGELCQ